LTPIGWISRKLGDATSGCNLAMGIHQEVHPLGSAALVGRLERSSGTVPAEKK